MHKLDLVMTQTESNPAYYPYMSTSSSMFSGKINKNLGLFGSFWPNYIGVVHGDLVGWFLGASLMRLEVGQGNIQRHGAW